jgi:acetoin utilization protein AcuB
VGRRCLSIVVDAPVRLRNNGTWLWQSHCSVCAQRALTPEETWPGSDDTAGRAGTVVIRPRMEATMKVREIMTTPPLTVGLDMPVLEAQKLMTMHRIRHLPVTDGGRLVGFVTDRDSRLNLPSPATSLSIWEINYLIARLTVESVMTKAVITVTPDRDAAAAGRIMLDHKIGALPVVDRGMVVGIVTESEMLRAFVTMVAASSESAIAVR